LTADESCTLEVIDAQVPHRHTSIVGLTCVDIARRCTAGHTLSRTSADKIDNSACQPLRATNAKYVADVFPRIRNRGQSRDISSRPHRRHQLVVIGIEIAQRFGWHSSA
jgi:hypothetical protein